MAHKVSFGFRDTDEGPERSVWVAVWDWKDSGIDYGTLYHTASFHLAALLDALLTGVELPVVEIEIAREWS